MRAATRLTRENIARRLATTPAIIEDLENGAVSSLPHWRETVRIVRSYCELLRLDPEPLLWRFQQLLQSGTANGAGHELAAARPPSPPPLALRAPPLREPVARRGGGLRKVLLLAAMPIAAATLILLAALAPAPIYRAISLLPASLAEPARAGMDSFVLTSARREKGLRWIDVGDPQLRKVDKLPTKPR
jgi:cytoskeletal protein RodZ